MSLVPFRDLTDIRLTTWDGRTYDHRPDSWDHAILYLDGEISSRELSHLLAYSASRWQPKVLDPVTNIHYYPGKGDNSYATGVRRSLKNFTPSLNEMLILRERRETRRMLRAHNKHLPVAVMPIPIHIREKMRWQYAYDGIDTLEEIMVADFVCSLRTENWRDHPIWPEYAAIWLGNVRAGAYDRDAEYYDIDEMIKKYGTMASPYLQPGFVLWGNEGEYQKQDSQSMSLRILTKERDEEARTEKGRRSWANRHGLAWDGERFT